MCQGEHEGKEMSLQYPEKESRQSKLGVADLADPLLKLLLGARKPGALWIVGQRCVGSRLGVTGVLIGFSQRHCDTLYQQQQKGSVQSLQACCLSPQSEKGETNKWFVLISCWDQVQFA